MFSRSEVIVLTNKQTNAQTSKKTPLKHPTLFAIRYDLGPILFLLYCAEVTRIAERNNINVLSYADDTQLHCVSEKNLTLFTFTITSSDVGRFS